jgi:hypothetical protein
VAVQPFIHTLCMLNLTTESDPGPVINKGFSFLLQVLCSMPKMYTVFPTAIDTGLIGNISLCGRPSLSKTHNNLRSLLSLRVPCTPKSFGGSVMPSRIFT